MPSLDTLAPVCFGLLSALSLGWAGLFFVMALHEVSHALMHVALGGKVLKLCLGGTRWARGPLRLGLRPWYGATHYADQPALTPLKRLAVTAAGPAGNLAAAAVGFQVTAGHASTPLYVLAWMSLVAGALNLLPVLRFDGKRMLVLLMQLRDWPQAKRAQATAQIERATCLILMGTAVVCGVAALARG